MNPILVKPAKVIRQFGNGNDGKGDEMLTFSDPFPEYAPRKEKYNTSCDVDP